jgi:hypothetical protein
MSRFLYLPAVMVALITCSSPLGSPLSLAPVPQGYVLSIAGPTDMMFDPGSQDGRNISTLYDLIYQSETYGQNP